MLVTLAQAVFILLESLLSANIIKISLVFIFFWTYLLCLPCFCLLLWWKDCRSFPTISKIAFFWVSFFNQKTLFLPQTVVFHSSLSPPPSPTPFGWCQRWHLQCRWPPCTDLIHCPSCGFSEQSLTSWFGFFISCLVSSYPLQFCCGKVI